MVEFLAPSNRSVRNRWVRRTDFRGGEEICLFVAYAAGNALAEHTIFHARSWADNGFSVVIVVIVEAFDGNIATDVLDFASAVLIRENRGYDFGAWASALHQLPATRQAALVVLVNDSVYGPLSTFPDMLERVRTLDADVIGATESVQVQRHLQSYLLFFKPNALKSEAFWQFWSGIRASGRLVAIYRYELGLPAAMDRGGLRCATLFEVGEVENPTLSKWRDLIDRGFPYVKVAALRDNPSNQDISDWPQILRDQGYDPAIVVKHLAAPANWLRRMVVRFRL